MLDKMTELQDFDPDDFRSGPTADEKRQANMVDPAQMIEYASRENEQMLQAEAMVGTPFATAEHTQVHLAFMQSEPFKQKATPEILKIFSKHILEEATAQQMRGEALGDTAGAAPTDPTQPGLRDRETAGIMAGDAKALNPDLQQGPEGLADFMGRA